MMDLLVQVTTANKLSPAAHVLQPYGESGLLPYKPSTPIGNILYIFFNFIISVKCYKLIGGRGSRVAKE
jgi:hypothetical protein